AYGYGLVVYNVTGLVADGDNSFAFNKTSGNAAVYPSSLIVLVDNPASSTINSVYIVEEADLLSKTYNKNLDAVYSTAFDTVDGDATLYVFAAGAQAGEGDLVINGDTVSDVWSGTSETFDMFETSVDAGDIAVDFVSTGSTILALHQMVVVQNTKVSTNLDADNLVMNYKDGSAWTVTLTDENGNAISNAVVKIGIVGKVYNRVTDADGVASLPINLNPGTYDISATFDGTNDYGPASVDATVTVNKAVPVLTADNLVMSYKDGSGWTVTLTGIEGVAIPNVNVNIGILGKVYTIKTNDEGIAILPINLASGTYEINATFSGNKYYTDAFVEATVTVNKAVPVLTADDLVMSYKDGSVYSVTLTDANGNALANTYVKITIGTTTYNRKTDENGVANLPINLPLGQYDVTAKFDGDSKYDSVEITNKITVNKPQMSIVAEDVNMFYKDGTSYDVQLTDGEGNPVAMAGEIIKITINGKTYDRKTNSEGIATLPINLMAGTYTITAEYDGNTISNTVTVNKA
ncbi:MAG: Ig-like domain repeat protein, partial [Methanobrevibacter sp.]|uniref:DUF3344 domain-containing protein n=1 Tax=Methanobrevibacter sp. TaxID=66852 RepID=UPI0025DABE51